MLFSFLFSLPAFAGPPGAAGDFYVSAGNNVVQLDGPTGAYVGDFVVYGASGLDSPTGLTFGPNGNLFVASLTADAVIEFDGTTGALIGTFASGGGLNGAYDLVFGPNGNLFVSSNQTDEVIEYDGATGALIGTFASGGGLDFPKGLTFGPNGNLFVSSRYTNSVIEYDGTTGTPIGTFASGGGLLQPSGLTFGPSGNLFVSSNQTNEVIEYDGTTGAPIGVFASGGGLSDPMDLVFGPSGNLLVVSSLTGEVIEYDGSTGTLIGTFASGGGLSNPKDLVFGPSGNLFVSSLSTERVVEYDGATGELIGTFAGEAGVAQPQGLTFGPNGNLFVASGRSHEVIEYDGTTGVLIGTFASGGGLRDPQGLTFGPSGNLFVVSCYTNEVIEYDGTTGDLIGPFGDAVGCFGLTFGPNGNLFVIVGGGVEEYDGTTGASVGTFAEMTSPRDLTFGPDGNLFVTQRSDPGSVIEFDGATGALMGTFAGEESYHTKGLVFGPDHSLLVVTAAPSTSWGTIEHYFGDSGANLPTFAAVFSPQYLTFKPLAGPLPEPQITAFSPAQACGYLLLHGATASGTGLVWGARLELTRAGEPNIVGAITDVAPDGTGLTASFDLAGVAAGLWDAVVTYPDAQTDTLLDALELTTGDCPPPTVTGFSPVTATNCGNLTGAVITGDNLTPSSTVRLVRFGQPDIVGVVTAGAPTLLTVDFDLRDVDLGLWDAVVTNPDTQSSALDGALIVTRCLLGVPGDLYVRRSSKVQQYDGASGAFVGDFVPEPSDLGSSRRWTAWLPNGNLAVAHFAEEVGEYDGVSGELLGIFASGGGLDDIKGLAIGGPNDNLFVVSNDTDTVVEFDGATGTLVGTFAGPPALSDPWALTFGGPDGNLFVADNSAVDEFDRLTGALVRSFFPPAAVSSVAFGPNGNLFASGAGERGAVYEFDIDTGQFIQTFVPGGTEPDLAPCRTVDILFGGPNDDLFAARRTTCFEIDGEVVRYDGFVPNLSHGVFVEIPANYHLTLAIKPMLDPFPAPQLAGVEPVTVSATACLETVTVTVSGSDLLPNFAGVRLTAFGEPDIVGRIVGGTRPWEMPSEVVCEFDVAGATPGLRDVVFTYPDAQTDTLADALEITTADFCALEVGGLQPAWYSNCTPLIDAIVTGGGFAAGTTVTLTRAGQADIPGTNVDIESETALVADFDISGVATGLWNVVVTRPDVGSATLDDGFNVLECYTVIGAPDHLYLTAGNGVVEFDGASGELLGDFVTPGSGGLLNPDDLTFGPNGNLFVTSGDDPGSVIEFDGASGELVGDFVTPGSGGLYAPAGVTFGPNGNLFVVSSISGEVIQYDGTTGDLIGTFANSLGLLFGLTFGPNGNLFVASNSGVEQYHGATGAFLGPFATGISNPRGLTFGPNGNLFVTQWFDPGGVLEFDGATGELIGTFADEALHESNGLAFGPDHSLLVSSRSPSGEYTNKIERYFGDSGVHFQTFATFGNRHYLTFKPLVGPFPEPQITAFSPAEAFNCLPLLDTTIDGTGLVWGARLKLTRTGEPDIVAVITDIAPDSTGLTASFDLAGVAAGLWDLVLAYPGQQPATLIDALEIISCIVTDFQPSSFPNCAPLIGATVTGGGFTTGTTVTLTRAGEPEIQGTNVDVQSETTIVADFDVTGVALGAWDLVVTLPDTQTETLENALDVKLNCSASELGAEGDLYIAAGDRVVQYSGASGEVVGDFVAPGSGGLGFSVAGVAFGPNGNLFVVSQEDPSSRVLEYDGTTGAFIGEFVAPGSGGLALAYGLAFGPGGNLFVASIDAAAGLYSIIEYDGASGAFVGVLTSGDGSGDMDGLWPKVGLTFGPNGNLFVANSQFLTAMEVLEFDAHTGLLVGDLNSPWQNWPAGLAFTANGNLLLSNRLPDQPVGGEILVVDVSSGDWPVVWSETLGGAQAKGLAVGPRGNVYVITDVALGGTVGVAGAILELDGTTGAFLRTFVSESAGRDFLAFKPSSQPLPTPQLTNVSPIGGDGCTMDNVLALTVGGSNLLSNFADIRLTRTGELDITGHVVGGVAPTVVIVEFDLTGAAAGAWDVAFSYPDRGPDDVLAGAFTVDSCAAPMLVDASPSQSDNCPWALGNPTMVEVTVTGTGFVPTATASLVKAGESDIPANIVVVQSSSTLGAEFDLLDAPAGDWDLVVVNPDGQFDTLAAALQVEDCPPMFVTGFAPEQAANCDDLVGASVSGSEFVRGTRLVLTRSGEADIRSSMVEFVSAGELRADFVLQGAAPGLWNLTAIDPYGQEALLADVVEIVDVDCPASDWRVRVTEVYGQFDPLPGLPGGERPEFGVVDRSGVIYFAVRDTIGTGNRHIYRRMTDGTIDHFFYRGQTIDGIQVNQFLEWMVSEDGYFLAKTCCGPIELYGADPGASVPHGIMGQGDPLPGLADIELGSHNAAAVGAGGQYVSYCKMLEPGVDSSNRIGIVRSWNGELALDLRQGDPASNPTPQSVLGSFIVATHAVNAAGWHFSWSMFNTSPTEEWAARVGPPGDHQAVVWPDAPAHGLPGLTYNRLYFAGFGIAPRFNDAGEIAYFARVSDGRIGLWSGQREDPQIIALTGALAPGAGGAVFSIGPGGGSPAQLNLNHAGQVALRSGLTGPGVNDSNNFGIWLGRSGAHLELVLREGDPAFGDQTDPFRPMLNNRGDLIVGRINNTSVWMREHRTGEWRRLVGAGDVINGRLIEEAAVLDGHGKDGHQYMGGPTLADGLNDSGVAIVHVNPGPTGFFNAGSDAIYSMQLVTAGDYDGDGDVDGQDAVAFEDCFTGPDGEPADINCLILDFDEDGDIDCDDWAAFKLAWDGEGDPPAFPPCGDTCLADLDGNGTVGAFDLALLLGAWGPCDDDCPEDLDGSGVVGAFDLALLLGNWGECP